MFFTSNSVAGTLSPEVADDDFRKIAGVRGSPPDEEVVYNPLLCKKFGEACDFLKLHQHGLIDLRQQFGENIPPDIKEQKADEFAVAQASEIAIYEAWYLFSNSGAFVFFWSSVGPPEKRAKQLCLFAREIDKWIGPPNC